MSHEGRAPQVAECNSNQIALPLIGPIRLLTAYALPLGTFEHKRTIVMRNQLPSLETEFCQPRLDCINRGVFPKSLVFPLGDTLPRAASGEQEAANGGQKQQLQACLHNMIEHWLR
jgi:hypothetical protein